MIDTTTNKGVAEKVFDYLKSNPSTTQSQITDAVDAPPGRISGALVELFKKGMIGRHPTPNPNRSQSGGRRTVYRYWPLTDEYIRQQAGAKKGAKKKAKAKPAAKANKIKALVQDWEKDLITTTTGSTPVPPSSIIRPAPAATEANTVHHNVTVKIEFPAALIRLIEKIV